MRTLTMTLRPPLRPFVLDDFSSMPRLRHVGGRGFAELGRRPAARRWDLYYTNPYPAFENHTLEADYQSLIQCINTFAHEQLCGCCTRTMRHPPQCRTTSLTKTELQCRWIAAMRASDADIFAQITSAHVGDRGKGPVSTIATCRTLQLRNAADATFDDALMMGRMGARTVLGGIEFKYD